MRKYLTEFYPVGPLAGGALAAAVYRVQHGFA